MSTEIMSENFATEVGTDLIDVSRMYESLRYNSNIIRQIPMLVAVTFIKGRSGFERDGSYSTKKGDRWQMFDVGVACQSFCLAAKEQGLGTVIMGIFDEEKITELLEIPPERELAALIAVGWPDDDPQAPKRKAVTDLLEYK